MAYYTNPYDITLWQSGRHELYASLIGFNPNQLEAPQKAWAPSQPTLVYVESDSSKFTHNATVTLRFRTNYSEIHTCTS